MAKKRKASRSSISERPLSQTASGSTLASRTTDSLPDFDYVRGDLKKIGFISAGLFAFMIVLYFILPYISPLYAP